MRWTARHSKLKGRADRLGGFGGSRAARGAFTLIELLVVVAIIALLVSVLLPSLRAAREHAKEVVCGQTMRVFGNATASYFFSSKDVIPGVNTSGVTIRSLSGSNPEAMQDPAIPVQSYDWMTPLLNTEAAVLPNRRAQRFFTLLDYYKCPSIGDLTSIPYPLTGSGQDLMEFRNITRWPATSWQMPVHFQFWGQRQKNEKVGQLAAFGGIKVMAKVAPETWEVVVPSFRSRLNEIGTPANKAFLADGTRYLDKSGVLDHDVRPDPDLYGAFTSSGAWWRGDTAYGVSKSSLPWGAPLGSSVATSYEQPSQGTNLGLSYRHSNFYRHEGDARKNKGMMNIIFFDGHVELVNDQDSRKISYWYPKGAIVRTPGDGMTLVENGFVIP